MNDRIFFALYVFCYCYKKVHLVNNWYFNNGNWTQKLFKRYLGNVEEISAISALYCGQILFVRMFSYKLYNKWRSISNVFDRYMNFQLPLVLFLCFHGSVVLHSLEWYVCYLLSINIFLSYIRLDVSCRFCISLSRRKYLWALPLHQTFRYQKWKSPSGIRIGEPPIEF